jgi:hypothetical protein
MQVTILVCDRCNREMNKDAVEATKLDLTLKYDDPDGPWRPLRKREGVGLCPSCRDAFAEWLGDRGDELDGLRVDGDEPERVQRLRVKASATRETDEA